MDRPPQDGREPVQRSALGDLAAAEQLLVHHMADLRAFVRRRANGLPRGKESIDDVVQSICLSVLVRLHDERVEYRSEAEFRAWVYRAAQIAIAHRQRYWAADKRDASSERRLPPAAGGGPPEALVPSRSRTPSSEIALSEQAERTMGLLSELPESYRRVVLLARIDGLSHREIARRMGITEGASRMLLTRALERLAKLSEREPG